MRRIPLSQCLVCGLTTALALAASTLWGATTFPYRAYVTSDDVYIRSGPGRSYYPTEKAKAGQVVEVYRHDPGGWCAIRPPEGSFTWVSTRYLRQLEDDLAQVTTPHVAARVGSRFSNIRDVIQVRLNKDETVELLGGQRPGEDGWAKISPPSGEFRWIHSQYLDPEYPADGLRKNRPPDDLSRSGQVESATWVSADEAPHTRGRSADPPSLSPKEYQHRLEELDLELSIMVAEEPTVWQFDEMALEAEHLIAQAETAVQRGRARMLLAKIERFENIKDRYDSVEQAVADADRRDRRLATLAARDDSARGNEAYDRFDGRGRLTRVSSPRPGAPRYALVDQFGRVSCYVTPSPGMNLRHYEHRMVGVNGTRAYIPQQRAPHVMATHIDLLDDGRMR